jgi:predicted MPP superfamily phosphohydrolase
MAMMWESSIDEKVVPNMKMTESISTNAMSFPRRHVLRAGLFAWLASRWPWRLRANADDDAEGAFTFISVNDLHYREAACGPWFERVFAAMKQSAPRAEFCLACGDLADDGEPEQMAGARAALKLLEMPIHAVPGNHDYLSDADRQAYDENFPGQSNYRFEHRGWQFIGLDSSEGTKWKDTHLPAATFAWLDAELPKLDRRQPTIVFTHFPLGAGVTYRPLDADEILKRFDGFNVQAVFSGHWHGFTERLAGATTLTTDRCCSRVRGNHDGTKEKGWFVCEAKAGKVTRKFVEVPEIG